MKAGEARRFEVDFRGLRIAEQVDDTLVLARDFAVLLNGEQDVRRTAAVRDEDGALAGSLPGAADVLIKIAAGDGGDGHRGSDVVMLLHLGPQRPPPGAGVGTSDRKAP